MDWGEALRYSVKMLQDFIQGYEPDECGAEVSTIDDPDRD
jgi:hypothetical protein